SYYLAPTYPCWYFTRNFFAHATFLRKFACTINRMPSIKTIDMGSKKMRIGILSAGGDCPGINAAIRGVGKTAIVEYDMDVVGIVNGFSGLVETETIELTENLLSGILTL